MILDLGKIISNSFNYPFRDLKHLGFVFILFLLTLILPLGMIIENEITCIFGLIALLVFVLVTPGYMILVINSGINESLEIPAIKFGRSIINTFKLLILHILYVFIPAVVTFVIVSWLTSLFDFPWILFDSLSNFTFSFSQVDAFFGAILTTFAVTFIVAWIISIIAYVAKARLANSNSLVEALKIHKVFKDIKQIGIGKFLGWYLVMGILIGMIKTIAIFIIFIPYAGFIIFVGVIVPILALIYYYSLGLLYSSLSQDGKKDDELDLDQFEKELRYLKYRLIR